MNVAESPASTCHSMWQCHSHTPGLWALKRIMVWPVGASVHTSLRIGIARKEFVDASRASIELARHRVEKDRLRSSGSQVEKMLAALDTICGW